MALLKVGLTGGIASGKSTVSSAFKHFGIDVIDADIISRSIFEKGSPHLIELKKEFGTEIFDNSDELNRKALGNIVFNDPTALNWLNRFTHPKIAAEIRHQLQSVESNYAILDIPLLIGLDGKIPPHLVAFIDRVLVIDIPRELQLKRLCRRDKINFTQAESIIKTQSSREQKIALADDVIDNSNSKENTLMQVNRMHQKYLDLATSLFH